MKGFGPGIIKAAGKGTDTAAKTIGRRFGRALGVASIPAAAGAAIKGLYNIGATFDEVRDNLRVGTGATGEDLDAFMENVKNIGRVVPAEFTEIGQAVGDLNTRLGLTGEPLEQFAAQVLEAGRITGEALNIDRVADSFKKFGVDAEDMAGSLDVVYQVSQTTGVSMNDLLGTLESVAPAANTLGFSFEEAAAMAGTLENAGFDSSNMMSRMARRLGDLAEEGEKPRETFERVVTEIGEMVDAGDDFAAQDLAGTAFGTRNAEQFIQAIRDGTLSLEDLGSMAGMSGDSIMEAAEDTMSFGERWEIFKNTTLAELEPIALRVFDGIADAM